MVAPDETVPGELGPGKLVETGGNWWKLWGFSRKLGDF